MIAPSSALIDPQARVLNILDRVRSWPTLRNLIDIASATADDLVDLVGHNMIRIRTAGGGDGRETLDTGGVVPVDRLDRYVALMSRQGKRWVDENPTNALLRSVDASPLGRVTLVRALEIVGRGNRPIILAVVEAGYVTVHDAATHMEVGRNAFGGVWRARPESYVLLPTPKIRTVLGDRS